MSPGNEINKIESLLKFMYLMKQPATMPATTASMVNMSRRLSTSHLHPCVRKERKGALGGCEMVRGKKSELDEEKLGELV